MDNVITITLKDGPKNYSVEFESNPTAQELAAASLILDDILDYNYDRGFEYQIKGLMYPRITDIEKIIRI